MERYIDAGSLDQRLELLELKETAENTWEWVSAGRLWAAVTLDGGRNLFSSVVRAVTAVSSGRAA